VGLTGRRSRPPRRHRGGTGPSAERTGRRPPGAPQGPVVRIAPQGGETRTDIRRFQPPTLNPSASGGECGPPPVPPGFGTQRSPALVCRWPGGYCLVGGKSSLEAGDSAINPLAPCARKADPARRAADEGARLWQARAGWQESRPVGRQGVPWKGTGGARLGPPGKVAIWQSRRLEITQVLGTHGLTKASEFATCPPQSGNLAPDRPPPCPGAPRDLAGKDLGWQEQSVSCLTKLPKPGNSHVRQSAPDRPERPAGTRGRA
jgi:hypothetical protein